MSWMDEDAGGYQLKITLRDSKPRVWRRFVVPANIPLDRLHIAIQIIMGWENTHLHRFVIDGQPYCEQPEDPFIEGKEEHGISLRDAFNGGVGKFEYDYDFGDDWKHLIVVEEQLESLPKDQPLVLCMAGANACPPEDSGGAYWYSAQRAENPEQYACEAFDVRQVNRDLQEYIEWNHGQGEV